MITSDLFTNNSPALFENTGPVTHRIGLTVTDPNHPMVSKRKEPYQKSVRVTGNDREAAINQAIAHYRRKGYKVHDHHYLGTVDQGMAEGFNGEYDDEAGMAQGNLYTIAKAAKGLLDTIDDRDNLPEWVQEKIAKVEGMLVTSWNYMQSQKAQGIDPQITESICSLTEAEEIFNDFERSVQERGLSEDIYDTITDDEIIAETAAWRRKEGKSKKGGLNAKGVASYRRENPGSKLQMAVTTKPSKLKKGSKAAKRRKSFCARMSGVKGPMKKPNGKPTRKALALRKWNC